MADPIRGQIQATGLPVYFINSGDMRLVITGNAPTIGPNLASTSIVPTSLTDSNSNVASGSYTNVDSTIAGADGSVLSSVANEWTGYAFNSPNSAFSFGITDAPVDYATFSELTLTVRARVVGISDLDISRYVIDISGTNAPTDTITYTQADANSGFINRSFTNSSVTPSAADIDGWTVRVYQSLFSLESGDGLYLDIDEIEIVLYYEQPVNKQIFGVVGSLSLTGNQPTVSLSAALPAKGSLSLTGLQPLINPAGAEITAGNPDSLAITENSPTVLVNHLRSPARDTLAFSESQAARRTGLQFEGYSPELHEDRNAYPTADGLAVTGYAPDRYTEGLNLTRVPPLDSVVISGKAPSISWTLGPVGKTFMVISEKFIAGVSTFNTGSILTQGYAPTIAIGVGPPGVIIGPGANEGTVIRNTNADYDTGNRYEICDVTGKKCKPGELVQRWDGLWVHYEHYEPRHPLDLTRSKPEKPRGARHPEPVGSETFIDPDNPVTADDL